MAKKKISDNPSPPPPDDVEYPIPSIGEEETDDNIIKEELLKQYKSGKLALIDEQETAVDVPDSSEYPTSPMHDPYFGDDPRRLMPNQYQMKYLLHPDDVPPSVNKKLWGIVTRHLELINVTSEREIPYYQREVRQIVRVASWDYDMKEVSFADLQQVEFYAVQVLLKKSLHHGERLALMTTIQRSQVEEYGERSPGYGSVGGGGFVGAIKSFFGGGRR